MTTSSFFFPRDQQIRQARRITIARIAMKTRGSNHHEEPFLVSTVSSVVELVVAAITELGAVPLTGPAGPAGPPVPDDLTSPGAVVGAPERTGPGVCEPELVAWLETEAVPVLGATSIFPFEVVIEVTAPESFSTLAPMTPDELELVAEAIVVGPLDAVGEVLTPAETEPEFELL
jgi:hypothetical protein